VVRWSDEKRVYIACIMSWISPLRRAASSKSGVST
jgi:hypothetical protein